MRKLLIVTTLFLFVGIALLSGQEKTNEQQWYCIAETVKPDMLEQYLELSQELIQLCKEESFPYAFHTWSSKYLEYELWSPLESLDDIIKIGKEWDRIMEKWGKEKSEAFQSTKIKNYGKTCNVLWHMRYNPSNPDYNPNNKNFGRWIEVYLKPGTGDEFKEAFKWINEIRKAHDYGVECNLAECGLGYETPSFLVMYGHESLLDYLEYENSLDEEYTTEYMKYLARIQKIFAKSPKIYTIEYLPNLSYVPSEE